MKKLLLLLICSLLIGFVSCATGPQVLPEGCGDPPDSVIVASGIDIDSASVITRGDKSRLMILFCIDGGTCTKEDVLAATSSLRFYLNTQNPTYTMLSLFLGTSHITAYMSLAMEVMPIFNTLPELVRPCDKAILLRECDRIDMMVTDLL